MLSCPSRCRLSLPWLVFTLSIANNIQLLSALTTGPTQVLVAGASGRTGQLVFEALLNDSRFDPKALVRSEKSGKKLRKRVPATGLEHIILCDITSLKKDERVPGLSGIKKMVICSSAVPQISKLSLLKALVKAPWRLAVGKTPVDFRSLRFVWKEGQYPEKVDYQGQVALVDLAKRNGMEQVVVVGSMGGTDPSNFLNFVGKNPDGTGNGDILLWKRKGERYLVESGLAYTIIHPGGLTDNPAGQEEFVLDVDDKLLARKKRSISRADVANLCVAALACGDRKKIALDCVTQPREQDDASTRVPTAAEALQAFLQKGKTYNYAL